MEEEVWESLSIVILIEERPISKLLFVCINQVKRQDAAPLRLLCGFLESP